MSEHSHLLIVDDDKRIRELLRSYLVSNGYLISVAASAQQARERMRGIAFDLIILDVMMPGETGLSFLSGLRHENVTTPILMLSALADAADLLCPVDRARRGGIDSLGQLASA